MNIVCKIAALSLVLLALSAVAPATQPGGNPIDDKDVEVLAQGPIHEAFAQPVFRRQGAGTVVPKQPPPPVPELPAEQKPEGDVEWIPGYWAWDPAQSSFLWVSGIWRVPPPHHDWVPGYWEQATDGWRWVSGYWTAHAEVQLLPPPPDPIEEAVPPAPDDGSTYVPGCWIYTQNDYMWRPGYYVSYRPGWTWVSPAYNWTPGGYVFVDGYWDYPLANRGLLFAPVVFNSGYYGRSGWFYRPSYVMLASGLINNLFIGLGWNHYYYGNYYGGNFGRMGFYPWATWMSNNRYYDPLYGYARWQYRGTPNWETNLRAQYAARQNGTLAAPPRTYAQQTKVAAGDNSLAVVAPLNAKNVNIKLTTVNQNQVTNITKQTEQMRELSLKRSQHERQAARQSTSNPTIKANAFKLDTPKERKVPTGDGAPPARPKLPEPVIRTLPKGPDGKGQGKGLEGKVFEKKLTPKGETTPQVTPPDVKPPVAKPPVVKPPVDNVPDIKPPVAKPPVARPPESRPRPPEPRPPSAKPNPPRPKNKPDNKSIFYREDSPRESAARGVVQMQAALQRALRDRLRSA